MLVPSVTKQVNGKGRAGVRWVALLAGALGMIHIGAPGAWAEAAGEWVGATVARRVMIGRAQSVGQRVDSVFFVGRCIPVNR